MTTATVTNTIRDSAGNPVVGAKCPIVLIGAAAFDAGNIEIVGQAGTVTTDSTGTWTTTTLTPNSQLTPTGTYYMVYEPNATHAFTVPATGGPYMLNQLIVGTPTSPAASLGIVRYDVAQALTSAQQAQAQQNIGTSGGSGAVSSVFGRTGAVVAQTGDYTAAQVGADASGAASAAQAAAATDATNKVATEATARANADTAEASARAAADALLIPLTQKAAANGVATLDSGGKVPVSQLPSSVMEYQGTWNASTNTPTLVDGTGNTGDIWRVTVAGSHDFGHGAIPFVVGDLAVYDGSQWQRASAPDGVSSVAGRIGDVTLVVGDVSGAVPSTRQLAGLDLSADRTAAAIKSALGITESDVAGLTADLAGKVPTTRTLAGLDLSADRTAAAIKAALAITEADVSGLTSDLAARTQILVPTATKTSAYTAAVNDLVLCNPTSASFAVTLPTAPADKSILAVKKLDSSANTVTITCGGSDTFAIGGTTLVLALQGHAARLQYQSSTSKWIALDNDLPLVATDARYVAKSTGTAKGDTLAWTGSGTPTNVPVGSNGQVLTADSTQAAGVKWAAAPGVVDALFSQPTISGDYITPQFYTGSSTNINTTLNRVGYALIYLPAGNYSGFGIRVGGTGGTAGAVLRVGLYKPDASRGQPGTLVVDAGTVAATTANAYQTITLGSNVVWSGGLAWVAVVGQVATSSYLGYSDLALGAIALNSDSTVFGNKQNVYYTAGVTGAFASNPTMTYQGNNGGLYAPQIGVKVA